MIKNILVIGANSASAQVAIPVLAKANNVTTAGRKGCDVYCDITKDVTVPDGIDVIINFAAVFGGDTDAEIINAQKTNVLGTLNICVAAKKAGVKHIIIISSLSAVLGKDSPYYSIYAITKRQADELAQFYCGANGMPLTIIRPSQIYGVSDSFAKHQPLIYQIIDQAQKGEDVTIYGENDALRNYIHIADLAEIINRIVAKQVVGVYSCTYPSDIKYSQIARSAQRIFNKGGKTIFLKDKPSISDNVFTQDLAIYDKLNYYPKISIDAGIKRIKEYREGG